MYIEDKEAFYRYLYRHCHCCNAGQSPELRRLKYALAKYFGKEVAYARQVRDYNNNPFAKCFGYPSWETMVKSLNLEVKN